MLTHFSSNQLFLVMLKLLPGNAFALVSFSSAPALLSYLLYHLLQWNYSTFHPIFDLWGTLLLSLNRRYSVLQRKGKEKPRASERRSVTLKSNLINNKLSTRAACCSNLPKWNLAYCVSRWLDCINNFWLE